MISIKNVILPNKPLSNFELEDAVKRLKIPSFRGVFLLDTLPKKTNKKECGIVNFDKSGGPGTHWVACTDQLQPVGQVFCGHLCLYVLKELSMGHEFQKVLNKLF